MHDGGNKISENQFSLVRVYVCVCVCVCVCRTPANEKTLLLLLSELVLSRARALWGAPGVAGLG